MKAGGMCHITRVVTCATLLHQTGCNVNCRVDAPMLAKTVQILTSMCPLAHSFYTLREYIIPS